MDISMLLRAAAALAFVLGLIGLAAWGLKRFGWSVRATPARSRNQRLAVREVLTLDPRHRLVLLARDGVEHLVIMGHDGNRVIESGINAPLPPRTGGDPE